jgi:signal recognition particle subunit SRP54
LIIDSAGRLHIDKEMMSEIKKISKDLRPDETLFVCDAMTGQHAAEIAKEFNDTLELTGVILTKFDSDTRGGAAFSIKKITNKPIKFIGVSEKIDGLEVFHPERIASRILGMGDIVSLVEKAEQIYNEEEAIKLEKKMRDAEFTLQDFLEQMEQMSKLGPMEKILEMIPGMQAQMANINIDESKIARQKAIIQSMTLKERNDPRLILGSRKRRIARGAGVSILEVDKLLKNFQKSKQMMKKMMKNKNMLANLGNIK